MTLKELGDKLNEISISAEKNEGTYGYDMETGHIDADKLLLEYIGEPIITEIYESIPKWFA